MAKISGSLVGSVAVGLIIGGALGWIAAGEVADLPPLLIGHAPTVSLDNSQSSGGSSALGGTA